MGFWSRLTDPYARKEVAELKARAESQDYSVPVLQLGESGQAVDLYYVPAVRRGDSYVPAALLPHNTIACSSMTTMTPNPYRTVGSKD